MDMTAHQAELATCKRNIQLLVAALGSPSDSFSISLPYIQKLDNLTEKEFRALEQAATDKNDKYYFALSYNSLTLTGVIHWKPHPITGNLKNSFDHAVRESLKKLQPNVRNDCLWEGYRTSCKIYRGKYKGSRNASSFKWTYGFHQTAFLEVGFTAQSYAQLVDDAQMWLEGEKALQTIFLVQVEEDPEYTKSSMCNFSEEEIRYSLSLGDVNNPMAVPTDPSNPFGPIQINGSVWVGETKIFLEVWKRGDAGARRRGPRYVSYSTSVSYCVAMYADPLCLP